MPTRMKKEPTLVVSARLAGQTVAAYFYHDDACLSVRALAAGRKQSLVARVPALVLQDAVPHISAAGYAKWQRLQVAMPEKQVHHMYAELRGVVVPLLDPVPPADAMPVRCHPPTMAPFFCPETHRVFAGAQRVYIDGKKIMAVGPVWR